MEEVIYGDIYFVINFSMDFLVLYICGKILRHKMKVFQLIFAAAVGALYALIALFTSTGSMMEWIILFSVAALMCYIAFNFQSLKSLFLTLSLFISVNFLLSGGITALYSMINNARMEKSLYLNGALPSLSGEIPPILLILSALGSGLFSFIWSNCMKKNASLKDASVHIEQGDISIDCKGLCDSGNLLCEPISGKPVLILKRDFFSKLTGERFMNITAEGNLELLNEKERRMIRFIPMQSVGGTGMLIGLIPDKVTVNGEEKDVCIAPDQSGCCDFSGYDLLLSPTLLS